MQCLKGLLMVFWSQSHLKGNFLLGVLTAAVYCCTFYHVRESTLKSEDVKAEEVYIRGKNAQLFPAPKKGKLHRIGKILNLLKEGTTKLKNGSDLIDQST